MNLNPDFRALLDVSREKHGYYLGTIATFVLFPTFSMVLSGVRKKVGEQG